jgi:Flp pilus assembly protein TadD
MSLMTGRASYERRLPGVLLNVAVGAAVGLLLTGPGCAGQKRVVTPANPAAQGPVHPVGPVAQPGTELEKARAALAAQRTDDAVRHLESAIAAGPGQVDARLELAQILLKDGNDLDRAVSLVDEADRLRRGDPRAYRVRGAVSELRGDDRGAAAAYGAVLAVESDEDLRLRRAVLLERIGDRDGATGELQRVVKARPRDRTAHARLAELHERAGRLNVAEEELLFIASLAPDDASAQRQLAAFYRRHGQPEKARVADDRARALDGPRRSLRPLRPSKR